MILYHGSDAVISCPDLSHSRATVDFGKGFYTTPFFEQAKKWCERFKRRGLCGVISKYSFDENELDALKVLRFESYSEDWLDFIMTCRSGNDSTGYDIVIGGIANDKVFNTVELYLEGLIDKSEALKRLKYEKPNQQICFRTDNALKFLKFEGSEAV